MRDDSTTHTDRLSGNPHLSGRMPVRGSQGPEGGEGTCPAFGYLRGLHERASSIEFRLANGNSIWFPYGWLGTVTFNPSAGLLLKFTGDLVYLVLIRGSNLDRSVEGSGIDLIRAGLQRHRVLWVREMSEDDIAEVGDSVPTIDHIEISEFESHELQRKWIDERVPGFFSLKS